MFSGEIKISDYDYSLPPDRIALFPLDERDNSKMLYYSKGIIEETTFKLLANYIPQNSLLVFNNSKVINARIPFQKPNGSSTLEIFCLEPAHEVQEYHSAMQATGSTTWKCFVGGASKWKDGALEKKLNIAYNEILLRVEKLQADADAYIIRFTWSPTEYSFAEILEAAGKTPLPPYIKRDTTREDMSRYQTIYAKDEGSVAAPTAGLHFTDTVFNTLDKNAVQKDYVTLHVGAGTFKPVKTEKIGDHEMHAEYMNVSAETINTILAHSNITAVGTTSMRVLESLYWMGVKTIGDPNIKHIEISQWDVYQPPLSHCKFSKTEALEALLRWLKVNNKQRLFTQTQIMIVPGYTFRIAKKLITNFHQPQSTLLLLVAAAIGDDWKKIYDYAMENEFRFLSYGDANLIDIKNFAED